MNRRVVKPRLAVVAAALLSACADAPVPPPGVAGPELAGIDMTGVYVYMADAAVFVDCTTGNRYPVLIEGAHIDVERAYLDMREEYGETLQLTARFEIVERAPEPGMATRPHLRVVRFGRFVPGEDCTP